MSDDICIEASKVVIETHESSVAGNESIHVLTPNTTTTSTMANGAKLPLRNPALVAKQVSLIAVLSAEPAFPVRRAEPLVGSS